jgi:hypothetical protein
VKNWVKIEQLQTFLLGMKKTVADLSAGGKKS